MKLFNSTKKKVAVLAVGFAVLFGAGTVFGATDYFQNIRDYVSNLLLGERAEINATTGTNSVDDLDAALRGMKSDIETQLGSETETQKTRVTTEVDGHYNTIIQEAEDTTATEITNGKEVLRQEADTHIQTSKNALDNKFEEIFPTTPAE